MTCTIWIDENRKKEEEEEKKKAIDRMDGCGPSPFPSPSLNIKKIENRRQKEF